MLTAADITGYLLDRELLSPRAVVDGALRVKEVSRLNHVFLVTAESERCLVLKVAGASGDVGIAREAAVLERLRSLSRPLAACLPVPVAYDRSDGVLILESAAGARDLRDHHARGRFSRALAREAGGRSRALHAVPPDALDGIPLGRPAGSCTGPIWTRGSR